MTFLGVLGLPRSPARRVSSNTKSLDLPLTFDFEICQELNAVLSPFKYRRHENIARAIVGISSSSHAIVSKSATNRAIENTAQFEYLLPFMLSFVTPSCQNLRNPFLRFCTLAI